LVSFFINLVQKIVAALVANFFFFLSSTLEKIASPNEIAESDPCCFRVLL